MKSIIDNYTKDELLDIVNNSISLSDLIKKLGYTTVAGNNYIAVTKRLDFFNIDYTKLLNQKKTQKMLTDDDIYIENSSVSQSSLRRHYKEKNNKYKCDICGQEPFWNGKELTLILDHKNGVHNDNRLENLHWVCPNCNQQLETTGYKSFRSERKIYKKNYCKICGKEIYSQSVYCIDCFNKQRRVVERPSREELKELIRTIPFTIIGQRYGVSDNTIRKWCKAENLPNKVKEIKQISNEDWINI